MKWYLWVIILIVIDIIVNIFINRLAKKYDCYDYLKSVSNKEAKEVQIMICIGASVLLTLLLIFLGAFNSYIVFVIYLVLLIILAMTSSKIAKFFVALDAKLSKKHIDTRKSGKKKDLVDAQKDLKKMSDLLSSTSSKSKKKYVSEEEKAIARGEQDDYNFEEEELEEDDYYYEDDK